MTNYDKLLAKLTEMFQLDQADLDFGIYRIMNSKRDEIVRFLEKDLLPQVKSVLATAQGDIGTAGAEELKQAEDAARGLGMNPDDSPKVRELRAKYAGGGDIGALEQEVFNHLYSFFRRYYDEGDFLSLRRYKEGVYAIPYEGEEVKLHWANADQYYIKTAEHFRDFIFRVGEKRVHFKLVEADTEKDNNKAKEKRAFILTEENPVSEEGGELVIRFEYRAPEAGDWEPTRRETELAKAEKDRKKPNQSDLLSQASATILTSAPDQWRVLLQTKAPTDKEPNRTVLAKHLTRYTASNTFDYFIHKDLGGFLRRELDFYIKNEVMHLDDIEHEAAPKVEQYLAKVRAIRRVAGKVIDFLAQLEEFQKTLWLKKKFVVDSQYLVTLDRVPESLYAEIAANEAQKQQWVALLGIDAIDEDLATKGYTSPLTVDFLKENQGLVLDTAMFSEDFTRRLLATVSDFDASVSGILVASDNFHAAQLARARFGGGAKIVIADPPYNTKSDDFLYKDSYKHSSWLCMMRDRSKLSRELLAPDGVYFQHIDENEHSNVATLLTAVFGEENRVGDIIWKNSSKNDEAYVSMQHEYIVGAAKDKTVNKGEWEERKEGLDEIYKAFEGFRKRFGTDWKAIHKAAQEWFSQFNESNPIFASRHYSWMDERGVYFPDNIAGPRFGQYVYKVLHPTTGKPCKPPASGWRFPEEVMKERIRDNLIHFGDDETTVPCRKTYLKSTEFQSLTSIKYKDGRAASKLLEAMFGDKVFKNPKDPDLTARLFRAIGVDDTWVIDPFGGSGTTAHAVLSLRRESRDVRFFISEFGSYFEALMKPRIVKAAYAQEWRDGKPTRGSSLSVLLKVIRLESYEDSLTNLVIRRPDSNQAELVESNATLREEYMLRYMLNTETSGSPSTLNVQAFDHPFEYKLKVAADTVGETKEVNVDLVETFNWLLGLRVHTMDVIRGFHVVTGRLPGQGNSENGDKALIIWRDTTENPNEKLDEFFAKQAYNTLDQEFDVIYVNGDNNLQNLRRDDQTWKVRLIEEEFHRLMWDVEDV